MERIVTVSAPTTRNFSTNSQHQDGKMNIFFYTYHERLLALALLV